MPLEPGQKLGSYEVRGPLGAGGMGEVYRALDASIGREVALKILPPLLAGDPERLARFDREARLLGSLNHANIATLYGFERGEKIQVLVMELVEGESLAQRLKRGPLPLDETLEIFQQIAEGLESAHDSGIIHRDLKPGNIMITPAGRVKLLDFGLAKALEGEGGVASDASMSPTLTGLATARGEVMGTAYYMSPEQARGKPVDRRTDIWAFGCALYECVTGRMAFHGETISDTIALILQREPDLASLPADLPPRITELLSRCFEKDARRRLRDIGEARLEIEKVRAGNLAPTHSSGGLPMASGGVEMAAAGKGRSPIAVTLLIAAGLVAGAALTWLGLRAGGTGGGAGAAAAASIRFSVEPPDGFNLGSPLISPDSSRLIYHGRERSDTVKDPRGWIYVRSLDSLESVRIDATEEVQRYTFSPDGRWIAYAVPTSPGATTSVLRKLPIDGSAPPLTLCEVGRDWLNTVLWPEEGLLVALTRDHELVRIHADGTGVSEPQAIDAPPGIRDLSLVSVAGSGSRLLANNSSWTGRGFHQEAWLLDYDSLELRLVLDDATSPWLASTGHIVFTRGDTLFGVRVDADTLAPEGAPVPLLEGLGTEQASSGAVFDLGASGTLVYRPGGRWGVSRRIVHVDPAPEGGGSITPWSEESRSFQDLDVSPDGSRLAVTIMADDLNFAVWVSEMKRSRLRLLAKEPGVDCSGSLWHPDNETIFYACNGTALERAGVYRARADGTGERERILKDDTPGGLGRYPQSITPDGRWLLLREGPNASASGKLQLIDLDADDPSSTLRPLADGLPPAWAGRFSPDGRLVAYLALTPQRRELQVRRFNADGSVGPAIIAADGELGEAYWRPVKGAGGLELTYGDTHGRHWTMLIRTEPSLAAGEPRPDFDSSPIKPSIDYHSLLPDGRYLAIQSGADEDTSFGAIVVVNWLEELKRKMAAAR